MLVSNKKLGGVVPEQGNKITSRTNKADNTKKKNKKNLNIKCKSNARTRPADTNESILPVYVYRVM